MFLSDYIAKQREILHDLAGNDWTDAELTATANSARTRVALDTHCVRRFIQNLQAVANQETYPFNGGVAGIVITNGGTGYTSPVSVVINSVDGNGTGAAATATQTGGVVTAVNITSWGQGYTSPPTVNFVGGPGINATATAIVPLNVIDHVQISILWAIQRYVMTWMPFTPFNAFVRCNTTARNRPTVWTSYMEQSTLYIGNIPDQNYTMEWDAIVLPTAMTNTGALDTEIFPPYDDAVQWYASHLAMLKMQNFAQAEYLNRKYEKRIGQIISTRQDRRDPNVYKSWWRRLKRY